jgi:hypothetical protein
MKAFNETYSIRARDQNIKGVSKVPAGVWEVI